MNNIPAIVPKELIQRVIAVGKPVSRIKSREKAAELLAGLEVVLIAREDDRLGSTARIVWGQHNLIAAEWLSQDLPLALTFGAFLVGKDTEWDETNLLLWWVKQFKGEAMQ
jgi:hypothetical protein